VRLGGNRKTAHLLSDRQQKVGEDYDPFGKLPVEIIHMIVYCLPRNSVTALIEASWVVSRATSYNGFWKQLIRHSMPWFWELQDIVSKSHPLDYKHLHLFMDRVTTPTYGTLGPFPGIPNRRRIWDVCQQLASPYFRECRLRASNIRDDDESARKILENSRCRHMPMVSHPQPEEAPTISTQWIRSWQEADEQSATFETFWNSDGFLVGLGVAFGASRRDFGYRRRNADDLQGCEPHSGKRLD
jgi:hypothetical protein